MVRDAEQHAAEDSQRKEGVEARNMADSAIYSAEKFLSENGDKIPEASKSGVEAQIAATKAALESGDVSGMQTAVSQLQAVMQEAGSAMYQQQGPAADGQATPEDEDFIEGEFSDA
jgi:molecular chaperone DnaK